MEDAVVHSITMEDLTSGRARLPFMSRGAWKATQTECSDLRRVHSHLMQGTRPFKKVTTIKDVKRYLQQVTIAHDGLLVVERDDPFAPTRECIVVPRSVACGLLQALHIKLNHPSHHQLKCLAQRYFFILDLEKTLEVISEACHTCAALRKVPSTLTPQSTSSPPEAIGSLFSADIIKRARQCILAIRESVTSYTVTQLVENERSETLREALIRLLIEMCPMHPPAAVVRTDPAPGFQSLISDKLLEHHNIQIELGRVKNKNKNPIADKCVQELENELLRQEPGGGPITSLQLSVATAQLNSRLRSQGLSSRKLWTQWDQFTQNQLPLNDQTVIERKHATRVKNHPYSEISKAPHGRAPVTPAIKVGDLVYLRCDGNKNKGRARYLVTAVEGDWCEVRKFIGSQLRTSAYRVKRSECFTVPNELVNLPSSVQFSDEDSDNDIDGTSPEPPGPDVVNEPPHEIIMPLQYGIMQPSPVPTASSVDYQSNKPAETEPPLTHGSEAPRRSGRSCKTPEYLNDYIMSLAVGIASVLIISSPFIHY